MGAKKRKSNNDDKHDHGQEKKGLSTYVEGEKQYRREALDSESSKALFWSNFRLLGHPFRSVLVFPMICARFGFDFALISPTFCVN